MKNIKQKLVGVLVVVIGLLLVKCPLFYEEDMFDCTLTVVMCLIGLALIFTRKNVMEEMSKYE